MPKMPKYKVVFPTRKKPVNKQAKIKGNLKPKGWQDQGYRAEEGD